VGNKLKYPIIGNHYEVLGIKPFTDVSQTELDRKKQKRQTYFHKEFGASTEGHEIKNLLNRATNELKIPHKKAAYDKMLKKNLFLELDGMIVGAVLDDRSLSGIEENKIIKRGISKGLTESDISLRIDDILKVERAVRIKEREPGEKIPTLGRIRRIIRKGVTFNLFAAISRKTLQKDNPFSSVLIILGIYSVGFLAYIFVRQLFTVWSLIGVIFGFLLIVSAVLMIHKKKWVNKTFEDFDIFLDPMIIAWILLIVGSGILFLSSKSLFYATVPLYMVGIIIGLISKQFKLLNLTVQIISIAAIVFSIVFYLKSPTSATNKDQSMIGNVAEINDAGLIPGTSIPGQMASDKVLPVFGTDKKDRERKKDRKGIFASLKKSGPEMSTSRIVYLRKNVSFYAEARAESALISEIEAPASIRVFKEMSDGEWYYGRFQNEFGWLRLTLYNAVVGESIPCRINPGSRNSKTYELPSVYADVSQSVDPKDTVYFLQSGPENTWGKVQISGNASSSWIKLDNIEIVDE